MMTLTIIIIIFCTLFNGCFSLLQPRANLHHDISQLSSIAPLLNVPSTSTKENAAIQLDEQQLVKRLGPAYAKKVLELAAYKEKHGNCLVPKRYEENPALGNWVNKQRQMYRKYLGGENSSMNEERIKILNQLGFVYKTSARSNRSSFNERAWQKMYDELYNYYKIHGDTNVPSNTPLGQWAVRQRYFYRSKSGESSLSEDRIEKLNLLGFRWSTRYEALWDQRINELKEFKRLHGHCMVPRNYKPNKKLSSWVATQRRYYNLKKMGKPSYLTDERQRQLESMDFVWCYWDHNFRINEFK